MAVLSPSCWFGHAGPSEPSASPATPRTRAAISPTYQSSIPFGPNASGPEPTPRRELSETSKCALVQRKHFSCDAQQASDKSVLPHPGCATPAISRSKSEGNIFQDRGRRHWRPEDHQSSFEYDVKKELPRTPRGKSCVKEELNFFLKQGDPYVNRRHRIWESVSDGTNGSAARGRSAPPAVARKKAALFWERCAEATPPSATRSLSRPREPTPSQLHDDYLRSAVGRRPSIGRGVAAPERDAPVSADAPVPDLFALPPKAAPYADCKLQAFGSATPPRSQSRGRSPRPDRPGSVWNSGCRQGAVMGVGSRTVVTPIKAPSAPSDNFWAGMGNEPSPASTSAAGAGGPSTPRSAQRKAWRPGALGLAASDDASKPTPRARSADSACTKWRDLAASTCTHKHYKYTTVPTVYNVPHAAPHLSSSDFMACTRFSRDFVANPPSRFQPHHDGTNAYSAIIQSQAPLPCGEDERLPSGIVWKNLSPRMQLQMQQKQATFQGTLQGAAPTEIPLQLPWEKASLDEHKKQALAAPPFNPPYGWTSDDPQAQLPQRELTMHGGLYSEHLVQLLSRGQLQLRGPRSLQDATSAEAVMNMVHPEFTDYGVSTINGLSSADLRSFSRRLQESNMRVKSSLYQIALSERMRNRQPQRLSTRPAYDMQTGRLLKPKRSLSSGDANRQASGGTRFAEQLGKGRVMASTHGSAGVHLPLPPSKTSDEKTPRGEVSPTPATSIGRLTPSTGRGSIES